jgi:hypothetical protein
VKSDVFASRAVINFNLVCCNRRHAGSNSVSSEEQTSTAERGAICSRSWSDDDLPEACMAKRFKVRQNDEKRQCDSSFLLLDRSTTREVIFVKMNECCCVNGLVAKFCRGL